MVHSVQFIIAGLPVNIFSASPLSATARPVIALFLLHGRLESASSLQSKVEYILDRVQVGDAARELIIITFDHRNHGKRLTDPAANDAWNKDPEKSNDRHAIDMYAIQTGTALDVSHIIDFLPSYLFPDHDRIVKWGVAGISLGGHSTWIALSQDKRIEFGIPIIGCPNYLTLIAGRAAKYSIPLKSPYFPDSLKSLIETKDPASRPYTARDESNPFYGKKILVLSGEIDHLVPWEASRRFVETLEVGPNGLKRVVVQRGTRHECTKEMLEELAKLVLEEYLG